MATRNPCEVMSLAQPMRRPAEPVGRHSRPRARMADHDPVTPSGRGRGRRHLRGNRSLPRERKWQARMPHAVLMVVVIDAGADALRCHLSAHPDSGVFALAFAPWPAATVLKCPLAALPAKGRLSVRDVRVITRMGRTVRYLVPEFTTP